MGSRFSGVRQRWALRLTAALTLGTGLLAAPAHAATSSVDHVQPDGDALQVVVSVGDVPASVMPDLKTATVTFDGEPVPASATSLSESAEQVRRTAVLAMDVSNSMRGAKFDEAKAAAEVFLDTVPDDVFVGLVTFADAVTVVQEPTQDSEAVRAALNGLTLSPQTSLNEGVVEAVDVAGEDGSRSILVLSDGRDTSETPLAAVTGAIRRAEVKVDVVALAQKPAAEATLAQIADAGNGRLLSAGDPAALSRVFAEEAQALAQQVLVTVNPPAEMAGREGTIAVTLQVDGTPTTDEAFVSLPKAKTPSSAVTGPALQPVQPGLMIPQELMYAGLGAAVLGVLLILVVAVGGSASARKQDAVDRSIEAYTREGAKKLAAANREAQAQSMTQSAVAVAESVLDGQKGLEVALGDRLEAAGMALKPAEWLLVHAGIAVGVGVIFVLLGGGSPMLMLLGLFLGVVGPWLFLSLKRRRRLSAFSAQLADTLQLMAGSLSAGLSLAQSIDTVVREGVDPMAGEFRRAMIEARLGVEIEEALTGVAGRMQSVDFEWIVMAIRIQREVGGNLSELLNKVAETIREREYLERQVKTLSAEGRLSVWILGGLPPGFMAYLGVANPSYVRPLFTNPLGWAMLIVMTVLLSGGILWMKKVVKVEV